MKAIQLKSVFLILMCVMILGSVITPSVALLNDLKMELMNLDDFSEEESSVFEHECFEKEMVLDVGDKHDLIFSMLKKASLDFHHVSQADHAADIFLPPPEDLS